AGRQALIAASIQDAEFRLADLRQAVQKVQSEAERLLERREQMGVQINDADDEERRLLAEVQAAGERRLALQGKRGEKLRLLAESRVSQEHAGRELQALERQIESCRAGLADRRMRFDALRFEQVEAAGTRAERERHTGELRERGLWLERQSERLREERTLAEREAALLVGTRETLLARHRQAAVQLSLL